MEVHMMRCVYWIPAFAGMTVVLNGSCRADFIPAFAGIHVRKLGSSVTIPGAQDAWTPAFHVGSRRPARGIRSRLTVAISETAAQSQSAGG